MATTIIAIINTTAGNQYRQYFDFSDDSVILLDEHGKLLLRYDSNGKVRKPDGSLYGKFIYGASSWLFEKHDGTVIPGNSVDEPDGLIYFEVEISKMYIGELDKANGLTV